MDIHKQAGSFTFGFIKPHLVREGGTDVVMNIIKKEGFSVVIEENTHLSTRQVLDLYPKLLKQFPDTFHNSETVLANTSGEVKLFVLWTPGGNCVNKFRKLILGDPIESARDESIRAKFSISHFQNAIHGSDCEEEVLREIGICSSYMIDNILANNKYNDNFFETMLRTKEKEINGNIDFSRGKEIRC